MSQALCRSIGSRAATTAPRGSRCLTTPPGCRLRYLRASVAGKERATYSAPGLHSVLQALLPVCTHNASVCAGGTWHRLLRAAVALQHYLDLLVSSQLQHSSNLPVYIPSVVHLCSRSGLQPCHAGLLASSCLNLSSLSSLVLTNPLLQVTLTCTPLLHTDSSSSSRKRININNNNNSSSSNNTVLMETNRSTTSLANHEPSEEQQDYIGAAFKPGDAVEARQISGFEQTDALFVPAQIRAFDASNQTYTVEFGGGRIESNIPVHYVQAPHEEVLFQKGGVQVVRARFASSPALVLRFESDAEMVQAVALLDESNGTILPNALWEVNQALVLSHSLQSVHMISKHARKEDLKNVALLGIGVGTLARTLDHVYNEHGQLRIVGAERSHAVVQAGEKFFALQELPVNMHVMDATAMLDEHCGDSSLDLCIVDLADETAEQSSDSAASNESRDEMPLALPPEPFCSANGLQVHVLPKLSANGVLAMNAMGGRRALRNLCLELERVFPSVSVLATDPNVVFVCSIQSDALPRNAHEAAAAIRNNAKLAQTCETMMSFIERSEELARQSTLIGFFTASSFRAMLNDPDVVVV